MRFRLLLPLVSVGQLATAQVLPPSPAAGAIARAERAFAADAAARGTKPAFLAAMTDSAIVFKQAAPALAKAVWTAKPNPKPADGQLRWAPTQVGVATAGDLGYTAGPWVFADSVGKTVATGHFFTVWVRQPDGSYRWVLDNGTDSPLSTVPAALPTAKQITEISPEPTRHPFQRVDLAVLDARLGRDRPATYATYLHPRAQLLRDGQPLLTAPAAIRRQLAAEGDWVLRPLRTRVAASGDLAYSYGTYAAAVPAGSSAGAHGSYVHLWVRSPAGWQLLVESTNPAP